MKKLMNMYVKNKLRLDGRINCYIIAHTNTLTFQVHLSNFPVRLTFSRILSNKF